MKKKDFPDARPRQRLSDIRCPADDSGNDQHATLSVKCLFHRLKQNAHPIFMAGLEHDRFTDS
jgi:hypothetical protein